MAKIRIDPNRGRPGDAVWVRADILEIDLNVKRILRWFAVELTERVKEAIRTPLETPEDSTILRRGAGALWNVTGKFLSGIEATFDGDGFGVVGPDDRLIEPFVKKWLFASTELKDMSAIMRDRKIRLALAKGIKSVIRVIKQV